MTMLEHKYSRIEIGLRDRFVYNNNNYVAISYDDRFYRFQKDDDVHFEMRLSHEEIYQAILDQQATVHYDYHTKSGAKMRQIIGDKVLADFSDDFVKLARYREQLVLQYEKYCAEIHKTPRGKELEGLLEKWSLQVQGVEGTRKRRCDQKKNIFDPPTVKSFHRYLKEFLSCERDVRSLLPRHHGPGYRHQAIECSESYQIWLEIARSYASRRRPSKAFLLKVVQARIFEENEKRSMAGLKLLIAPKRKRFESLINAMDEIEIVAGRDGPAFARAYYKSKMAGYDIERPGQRVEFDDWHVDMMTLLIECGIWRKLSPSMQEDLRTKRLWLCTAIDAATRYVLGLKATFEPSSSAVISTLEMMMSDKTHISQAVGAKTPWIGLVRPETAYTDNGGPYISDATRDAFMMCKVDLTRPPAGHPEKRPFIESLFKTLSGYILAFFDGGTQSSVKAKGDYDAAANATLTADEFVHLFIRAICDIYHNQPTPRLNGNTPHNAWVEKTRQYNTRAVPSRNELRHIFGATVENKKITSAGITLWGVPYNSDVLQSERRKIGQRHYKVRYHQNSLFAISVLIDGKWLSVNNTIGMDHTVTLAEWIFARKQLLQTNKAKVEDQLKVMYSAINDLRRAGESAALRAGISPHMPTAQDMKALAQQLFDGHDVQFSKSADMELDEVELNDDPLRRGQVAPFVTSTSALAEPQTPAVDEDNDDYNQF